MTVDADVIIIGAGPTGLALSNFLGLRGLRAVLIEARSELIDYPRAVGIDDEALRAMQAMGLIDEVLPHTVPDQRIRMVNGEGKLLSEINPTTREFGWPRRNGFVQPLVDRELLNGLDRFENVDVRFACEATRVEPADDAVTVTIRTADGVEQQLRSSYVVGCEGGRSITRSAIGVEFEGRTQNHLGLVIDVDNDPLGNPHAVFGGDPTHPFGTLQLPHGIRRWEVGLPAGVADDDEITEEIVHRALAPHVPDPTRLDVSRRRTYLSHARIAQKFRVGRVLLAGDAAHVMPVVAGQGWNSCIRDAINLSWKLDLVLRGKADESLLDSYEQERKPHVTEIVNLSLNMAKLMGNRSKVQSWARDVAAAVVNRFPRGRAYLSNQNYKPLPRYAGVVVPSTIPTSKSIFVADDFRSSVGSLLPQPRVDVHGRGDILLDEATGSGWRILMWNNDPAAFLSESTASTWDALEGTRNMVVPATQLEWAHAHRTTPGTRVIGDATMQLKNWFHNSPFSAVIVRPDNVIAAECIAQDLDRTLQATFSAARIRR